MNGDGNGNGNGTFSGNANGNGNGTVNGNNNGNGNGANNGNVNGNGNGSTNGNGNGNGNATYSGNNNGKTLLQHPAVRQYVTFRTVQQQIRCPPGLMPGALAMLAADHMRRGAQCWGSRLQATATAP